LSLGLRWLQRQMLIARCQRTDSRLKSYHQHSVVDQGAE